MILTEDGSKHGFETLRSLVREIVWVLDPEATRDLLKIHPAADREATLGAQATNWKSRSQRHRQLQVALRRAIATELAQDDAYVFFHIDGDRPWADRATSENGAKLSEFITRPVGELLRGRRRDGTIPDQSSVAAMLRKLVYLMPFYSIEAWTYQNVAAAKRICTESHDGQHLDVFDAWQADRAALDEVRKPKEACCLKDQHNAALASDRYPTREVLAVGKSFAACIDHIRQQAPCLLEALAAIRPR